MAADPEELASFAEECEEHLKVLEDEFLKLEKDLDNPDRNSVNLLFRAAHTIKGCSSFLDLRNITQVTHSMETLLDKVRNEVIRLSPSIMDGLLAGLDTLKRLTEDLAACDQEDISEVDALLEALVQQADQKVEGARKQEKVSQEQVEVPVPGQKHDHLKGLQGQEIDLATIPLTFQNAYFLSYGPGDWKGLGPTAEAALQNLGQTGRIVDRHIHQESNRLWAIFLSAAGQELIELITQTDQAKLILTRRPKPAEEQPPSGPLASAPSEGEGEAMEASNSGGEKQRELAADAALAAAGPAKNGKRKEGKEEVRQKESIRIGVDLLDHLMRLAGELVLVRNQQLQATADAEPVLKQTVQRLNNVTSELQEAIMRTRMQPVGILFAKYPRVVRDLGRKLNKQIELDVTGNEVELDKNILEKLADPLTHLIRNSCDHGLEPPHERLAAGKEPIGRISIMAFHEGGQIHLEIRDDGRGLNLERIRAKALEKGLKSEQELERMTEHDIQNLILLPGFSTAENVSTVSGRGVGMDVVKENISSLGGVLDLDSRKGEGTIIRIRLPLTLAILPSVIVAVGDLKYAIPQVNVEELICLYDEDVRTRIETAGGQEVFRLRDKLLPLVRLSEVFERSEPFSAQDAARISKKYRKRQQDQQAENLKALEADPSFVFSQSLTFASLKVGAHRFGLIVDRILGTEEIVVKPVHSALKGIRCFSGATVMGDGSVALILDVQGIAQHAGISFETLGVQQKEVRAKDHHLDEKQNLLLFRTSPKEQYAIPLAVIKRVETIAASHIESIGAKEYYTVDGQSTRILRLENHLTVAPTEQAEEMFLLLPNHIKHPFGLLLSEIIDIEETIIELNTRTHVEDGLVGTALIRGRLTLLPDIYRLIELAEPAWFAERKKEVGASRALRILLVEDSLFFRQLVAGYFESEGYEVVVAADGKEGYDRFEKEAIDIIVSDIQMPIMDGVEFIRKVRNESTKRRVPAIALTSLRSDKDRERAMRAGYNYYEIKLEREQLLHTVQECGRHIAH